MIVCLLSFLLCCNSSNSNTNNEDDLTTTGGAEMSYLCSEHYNPWCVPLHQAAADENSYIKINMGYINAANTCNVADDEILYASHSTSSYDITDEFFQILQSSNSSCLGDGEDQCCCQNEYGIGIVGNHINEEATAMIDDLQSSCEDYMIPTGSSTDGHHTHCKVMQVETKDDSGDKVYYSAHGSLNMQPVGMTCKGNNVIRFKEISPSKDLYTYFKYLWESVKHDDGEQFPDTGTSQSSGTTLDEVSLETTDHGTYSIKFYAGKAELFVGGAESLDDNWPDYINPPVHGEHASGHISFYDLILYDAYQLLYGALDNPTVKLYIAVYEIAEESSFIDTLWKFAGKAAEDNKSLSVTLYYQYDKGALDAAQEVSRDNITVIQSWGPNDKTPTQNQMHNKFMLLDVVDNSKYRKLYVTSSNLDEAGDGSGKLWQVGTRITNVTDWGSSSENVDDNLWAAYKNYFDVLTEYDSGTTQIDLINDMVALHEADDMNYIETSSGEAGIDAFFFPAPITFE
jgi:hypothetical protein